MLFRFLTIYWVLGSHPEESNAGVSPNIRQAYSDAGDPGRDLDPTSASKPEASWIEQGRGTARGFMTFGIQHSEILRKIIASAKYSNRREMYSVASEAFQRAKLPSIAYSTFERHLRTLNNAEKGYPSEKRFLGSHVYTPQHMEMLEELVLAHPNCSRGRLFDVINERFKNLGLRPIKEGTFRTRVTQIRKANQLPDNRRGSGVSK